MLTTRHDDHEQSPVRCPVAAALDARALAGLEGERLTRDALQDLPRCFRCYANVDIPNPRSRLGHNEADFLIAGPRALFVVEVKHHRGRVFGGEHDARWTVTRWNGNQPCSLGKARNAVTQVKNLVWLLRNHFDDYGHRVWVQGIVVFSHPSVELCIDRMSVPCLRLSALVPYLRTFSWHGSCDRGGAALVARLAQETVCTRALAA